MSKTKKPRIANNSKHKNSNNAGAPIDLKKFNFEMQAMMSQIQDIVEGKDLSMDELKNYFTGRTMDEIAAEARGLARSPESLAMDLVYQAHEASTTKKAVHLAEKALDIDPNCAEAFLVLEEHLSEDPLESLDFFDQAVEASERSLGEEFFKENKGMFWGLHETRPYMRAQLYKAQILWELRRQSEAIQTCWRLLELNPNDNQGVRYVLFDYLLTDHRYEDVEKLLSRYQDDAGANWQWNLTLYRFATKGEDDRLAIEQAKKAHQENSYVVEYLTGKSEFPDEIPASYSFGSRDEAICYLADSTPAWLNTPGALIWLKNLILSKPRTKTHKLGRQED